MDQVRVVGLWGFGLGRYGAWPTWEQAKTGRVETGRADVGKMRQFKSRKFENKSNKMRI